MKNKKRKSMQSKRSKKRKILILIEVLLSVLVILASYFAFIILKINKVGLDENAISFNSEVDASKLTGYTNVALFGLDSRDDTLGKGNRSDAIMIASINNNTKKIKLVSIYRDTLLDIGNGEYNKANSAYSYNGPEGALNMINKACDLTINKYISVSFKGLASAIDSLGGIDIEMTEEEVMWTNGYIAETSKASGIWSPLLKGSEIKDGIHHLNGIQATAFCRIRYTRGDDYKRTERQRLVLEKVFEKAKTMDFKKLISISNNIFGMIQTNIGFNEFVKLGSKIISYNITTTTGFPFNKTSGYVAGAGSVVLASNLSEDVSMLHKILFNEKDYNPSREVMYISNIIASTKTSSGEEDKNIEENKSEDTNMNDKEQNKNANTSDNTDNENQVEETNRNADEGTEGQNTNNPEDVSNGEESN